LNLLFNKSLNTFFSNKFNFKKNEHKLFLYTDEQSKVKKKFKSNINYLKAKKIKFEFVNYSKKINKFKKQNKISVWRFLGEYQKKSILHAKKNNALCCFIFPDEIHSENLCNTIIEKIKKYNFILVPSNEVYSNDIKSKDLKNLHENKLIKLKHKLLEEYNKKDFFNYNFFCSHQSRFYFKSKGVIYYKSIHLAPIMINPNYIKDIKNIYTIDGSLNDKENSYVMEPDEGLLLSLESNQDNTRDHQIKNNLFLLFFFRLISHIKFNIKNINGINPFLYLRTFKIGSKYKKSYCLKKFLLFDFFSFVIFIISYLLKNLYNMKKYLKQ
jgi:hypothetical protein|tara:strand:+ start:1297 stop:2274 length:978 start_codon:yes stop_codon:yes gene_type:complete